ncbi:MAG: division/cell wall cluster transcriptional repressor MraZ [Lachnospiraceae bacterium]|nr:division/cell wall cluster transcriptional repressor MraZ [Candidatus Equihabitans merdae]
MFLNTYEHSLDAKGRLIIPSKYRDAIPDGVVIVTRGWDGNLVAYTREAFENYMRSWQDMSNFDPQVRKYKRFLSNNAEQCELDKQGRILISQKLRDHAHLEKDVIISGNYETFEIWSPERWDEISEFGDDDTIAAEIAAFAQKK